MRSGIDHTAQAVDLCWVSESLGECCCPLCARFVFSLSKHRYTRAYEYTCTCKNLLQIRTTMRIHLCLWFYVICCKKIFIIRLFLLYHLPSKLSMSEFIYQVRQSSFSCTRLSLTLQITAKSIVSLSLSMHHTATLLQMFPQMHYCCRTHSPIAPPLHCCGCR